MAKATMHGRRGFGALLAGFVLTAIGFVIIFYEVWITTTIPLNMYTFAGIGAAGIGVALAAVGADRGIETSG